MILDTFGRFLNIPSNYFQNRPEGPLNIHKWKVSFQKETEKKSLRNLCVRKFQTFKKPFNFYVNF